VDSPHLVIPLGNTSADVAVLRYVRDRMDVAKFVEQLIDSKSDGLYILGQVARTYINAGETLSFDKTGEWRVSPSAGEKQ